MAVARLLRSPLFTSAEILIGVALFASSIKLTLPFADKSLNSTRRRAVASIPIFFNDLLITSAASEADELFSRFTMPDSPSPTAKFSICAGASETGILPLPPKAEAPMPFAPIKIDWVPSLRLISISMPR